MIKIIGCGNNKDLHTKIEAISKFVFRDMRLNSSIELTIKVTGRYKEFRDGLADALHYHLGPKEHEIALNKTSCNNYMLLVRLIAHEMRHLAQVERGRFKTYVRHHMPFFQYDGITWPAHNYDYWAVPWEVDALEYEETILRKMLLI